MNNRIKRKGGDSETWKKEEDFWFDPLLVESRKKNVRNRL